METSFETIWATYGPTIIAIVSAIGSSALTGTIAAAVINSIAKKISNKQLSNGIVNGVLTAITGKTMTVDLTTITAGKLAEIKNDLTSSLNNYLGGIDVIKSALAQVCNALSKSNSLTDSEKQAFEEIIKILDASVVANSTAKETVSIQLGTIEKTKTTEEPTEETLVNF